MNKAIFSNPNQLYKKLLIGQFLERSQLQKALKPSLLGKNKRKYTLEKMTLERSLHKQKGQVSLKKTLIKWKDQLQTYEY